MRISQFDRRFDNERLVYWTEVLVVVFACVMAVAFISWMVERDLALFYGIAVAAILLVLIILPRRRTYHPRPPMADRRLDASASQ